MCLARLTASVSCLWCLAQAPRDSPRQNLGSVREVLSQTGYIFIIYVLNLFGTECANLFPLMRAEGLLRFSDFSIHNETILSKRECALGQQPAFVCSN